MNNTFFENIHTLEDLRKQYRILLKQFHPDNGGDEEIVKKINIEYKVLFEHLKRFSPEGNESTSAYDKDVDNAIRTALNAIIHLNINIEICGSWIWVTGNTYQSKEELKTNGFKWSKNKKAWYWHSGEFIKFSKKTCSLNFIREKYGSEEIKTYKQEYIGA